MEQLIRALIPQLKQWTFPRGFVRLPESPDVIYQFTASIKNQKQLNGNEFLVLPGSESVLKAWLYKVQEDVREATSI